MPRVESQHCSDLQWVSFEHTSAVDIRLDDDANAANAIKLHLFILVVAPVTQPTHVGAAGLVLLVAFCQNDILIETGGQLQSFVRLDPGIVVNCNYVSMLP